MNHTAALTKTQNPRVMLSEGWYYKHKRGGNSPQGTKRLFSYVEEENEKLEGWFNPHKRTL